MSAACLTQGFDEEAAARLMAAIAKGVAAERALSKH